MKVSRDMAYQYGWKDGEKAFHHGEEIMVEIDMSTLPPRAWDIQGGKPGKCPRCGSVVTGRKMRRTHDRICEATVGKKILEMKKAYAPQILAEKKRLARLETDTEYQELVKSYGGKVEQEEEHVR